jgi:hypothetical protein
VSGIGSSTLSAFFTAKYSHKVCPSLLFVCFCCLSHTQVWAWTCSSHTLVMQNVCPCGGALESVALQTSLRWHSKAYAIKANLTALKSKTRLKRKETQGKEARRERKREPKGAITYILYSCMHASLHLCPIYTKHAQVHIQTQIVSLKHKLFHSNTNCFTQTQA